MGKGGQRSSTKAPLLSTKVQEAAEKASVWRSPYNPRDPNVKLPKIGEIKAAIPKHCFERSYVKSLYYVARDTAWAVGCVYVTSKILSTEVPSAPLDIAVWAMAWSVYAFAMGTIMFGPWILAHECGHGKLTMYR
jgi:fatty acid desaturase